MKVALDNTFLSPIFDPKANVRSNPETEEKTPHIRKKLDALVGQHSERGDSILVPTPALTEMLIGVPDLAGAIEIFNKASAFEIAGFDGKCAIEYAELVRKKEFSKRQLRAQGVEDAWQKIKFDWQIVIIAKVNRASLLYTDDNNQRNNAQKIGLDVKSTWELDLPAKYAQTNWLD